MKTLQRAAASIAIAAIVGALPGLAATEDESVVRELVMQWVESADRQDADAIENILHPATVQFIPHTKAPGGAMTIARDEYIAGIRAKKIGGSPRETKIHSVEFDNRSRNAVAKVEVQSQSMIFYQFIGLTKLGAREWKIVSVLSDIVTRE